MSTNINGCIIRQPIAKAYDLLIKHKKDMVAKEAECMDAALASRIEDLISQAIIDKIMHPEAVSLETRKVSDILWKSQCEISDSLRKTRKTGERDSIYDFHTELYLFPQGRQTLAMLSGDSNKLLKEVSKPEWMEDYHWQNSTDRPDDVLAIHWRRRERDWDKALPGPGRPADLCMTLEMTKGEILMHDASGVDRHFRPAEARIENAARKMHASIVSKKAMESSNGKSADYLHAYISAITESKENPEIIEQYKAEISEHITDLTLETLVPVRCAQKEEA